MKRTLLWYWAVAALVGGSLALSVRPAHADAVDKIAKKIIKYDAEAKKLGSGIRRPKNLGRKHTRDLATRRLIDAQVNFGVGNYDDAAIALYDFVEKNPNHPSFDEGLYYLGESLFQKGDYVASRTYFTQLVKDRGAKSKFYQQGLERLIELTLRLSDSKDVDQWLSALDAVPAAKRRSSVPYVRGKYHFFKQQWDEALSWLSRVPKKSEYYFQARYMMGASFIAKGNLGAAAKEYQALVRVQTKNNDDKRVVELSQMALGRIHYERDQPSKAIDRYLMVPRRSDLFDETLYEVAWVYVKNKEFDKALRALELLALTNQQSAKLPDVKILEGNLRIRKAQRIADEGKGNSKEEYANALVVFENTRETFKEPRKELLRLMEEHEDPRVFMAQITGRTSETFEVNATLPEVAAVWLRDEPEVKRVVGIEDDLGQIHDEIEEAERTIVRLEQALSTPSRVNIFPALAEKRTRATEIQEDLFELRIQLAAHQRARFKKYASKADLAELSKLQDRRQRIARELEALPNAGKAYGERIQEARRDYDRLDQKAAEVATIIDTTEAQLIALEKFMRDMGTKEVGKQDAEDVQKTIITLRKQLKEMRAELVVLRRDVVLAKDRAGTGDETAQQAKKLRAELQGALDAESNYMKRFVSGMHGNDQAKANQIVSATQMANSIKLTLDNMNDSIDAIVEDALVEVRATLTDEKARLAAYKQEYTNYEVESRELGGEILGLSFDDVAKKFYDVLIRSDVGVVDVAWSLKEAADAATKRLNFDQARERKTLDSDFADVIEEIQLEREQELLNKAVEGQ